MSTKNGSIVLAALFAAAAIGAFMYYRSPFKMLQRAILRGDVPFGKLMENIDQARANGLISHEQASHLRLEASMKFAPYA